MDIRFVDCYPVAMSLVREASPSVSRRATVSQAPLMRLELHFSFFSSTASLLSKENQLFAFLNCPSVFLSLIFTGPRR